MCRNIKTLHNVEPPATEDEMRASALQYIRKVSGTRKPAKDNTEAFEQAVEAVYQATQTLMQSLVPHGPKKDREIERQKAKARFAARPKS